MKKQLLPLLFFVGFGAQAQSALDYPHEGLPACENEALLPTTVNPVGYATDTKFFLRNQLGQSRDFKPWRRRCGTADYEYQVILSAYPSDGLAMRDFDEFVIEFTQNGKTHKVDFPLLGSLPGPQSQVLATSKSSPYFEYNKELLMEICEKTCTFGQKLSLLFKDVSSYNLDALKGLSGTWYDPAYDGSGFNVVQSPNGFLMYFYGYKKDDNGQAQWLLSEVGPKEIAKGKTLSLKIYSGFPGNGGAFLTKPTTKQSGLKTWGKAEVTFKSCTTGAITMTGDDGSVTHNIVKLVDIEDTTCRQ